MKLTASWSLLGTAPGAISAPEGLPTTGWRPAQVPGTVASALALGADTAEDLDASDWWYRGRFRWDGGGRFLTFEGLATLAEVWLNGVPILRAANMFRSWRREVGELLREENELVMVFRALAGARSATRPRARWKTALVDRQDLRWVRTTLLGRIPGWAPRLPPVGPWRAITLGPPGLDVSVALEGGAGVVRVEAHGREGSLRVGSSSVRLGEELRIPGVERWWPHTHGVPRLVPCVVEVDGVTREVPLGFRTMTLDRSEGRVQLVVNGRPIFARGACWTVADLATVDGTPEAVRATLERARDAGVNLIRVGGTMTYGSDTFYGLCDELGILVWQDFMFANMDYPFGDAAFRAEVDAEVTEQIGRLRKHPSIAVYCGGSEVAQQAAMLGFGAETWTDTWYTGALAEHCARLHPEVPYFPSTPWEGALPFHTSVGITHYYGVGAYRRPLSDVRQAAVKFTPECLGFSNVPDVDATPAIVPHHPAWKAGVPRDSGAGWDFEDVRDHYLSVLFGVDPVALRSADLERYLALSRVVTGELMLRVFAEWRRPGSGCGGGLVWFLRDLRPGAGWGVLDAEGRPKPVYWYLRRAWAPRAVLLTDEGLDGLSAHVHNETERALEGTLEVELLRGRRVGAASMPVRIAPFSAETLGVDALFGTFSDLTYAYRFGPPRHDVVVARLRGADGGVLHEDAYFPLGHTLPKHPASVLSAVAEPGALTLEASVFLQAVTVEGFSCEDDHFHLTPGQRRTLRVTAGEKGHVGALNLDGFVTVRT